MISALFAQPSRELFSVIFSIMPPTPKTFASAMISTTRVQLPSPLGSHLTVPSFLSLSASVVGLMTK